MKVVIPVFKGCVSASVIGMMDMLILSRNFYLDLPDPREDWFDVELVSLHPEKEVSNNGFKLICDRVWTPTYEADIVLLPAMVGDLRQLINTHKDFIHWMSDLHDRGTLLCSTCNGAFFIAATGKLDGKKATTSWFSSQTFRHLFPAITLEDERILVDNGHIITGGATMSFQNLCIYLIEKYFGTQIGNYAAKMFLVEKGRSSQLSYSIFNAQKHHDDPEVLAAQQYIEQQAREKIIVSQLAAHVHLAERTFIRRFKHATGNTPSAYIQRVKIELAKKLLEDPQLPIKSICYDTGYEDQSYFRNMFKKYTGKTPNEYRKQFTFHL